MAIPGASACSEYILSEKVKMKILYSWNENNSLKNYIPNQKQKLPIQSIPTNFPDCSILENTLIILSVRELE